jgi:signal transduction histidine kinase
VATDSATSADAALLRRTRLRLIAWSGGLTLLVLVILGVLIYTAADRVLAARGTELLADRADEVARIVGRVGAPIDRLPPRGLGQSGTISLVVRPDGTTLGRDVIDEIEGLPDTAGVEAAAERGGSAVTETEIAGVPVRVYSRAVERDDGTYVVQVIGGRAGEQQLLRTLLLVLTVGGVAAVALALGAGYVYAGRALVPIRASMARRDAALRRQREFAANASHELRTPLTVVRASVTDLRRNPSQAVGEVGSALDDIEAGVDHLTALVDDLLLLARADSGALELERSEVDLADTAAEVAGAMTALATARGVAVVVDPRPAELSGDPLRLRQLVTILVDNALTHSPVGGTVLVRVRPEGSVVSLAVEDDGPGIRQADLGRVFERFWRADDAPDGGTGLGLAIAAWIVARHGGTIAASNRPAGGARLEARLPVAWGEG